MITLRYGRVLAMLLLLLSALPVVARAQNGKAQTYQYMQMTTVESIVAGGLGRSRVLFTPEYKGTKESTMENLFSLTGINVKNVQFNEELIVRYMGEITADGWELMQVIPLTQTLQNTGTTGQGIFLTRYLFRKAK